MAFHYVGGDRDQLFLLAMDMRDWLDDGHLAWFIIDAVAVLDTARFDARHANDGPGRPAYSPRMMLGLLFYGYGVGVRSSRRIEAMCRTDAAFKVIAGGVCPDHATIARFVVDHQEAIEELFVQVLALCAAEGLLAVGTVALDGTKMAGNASLKANRARGAIEAELDRLRVEVAAIVAAARAADAADDAQAELFDLDRAPQVLGRRDGRRARLEAALAVLETAEAKAGDADAKVVEAAEQGRSLSGRKLKDPKRRLARAETDAKAAEERIDRQVEQRSSGRAQREARAAAEGRRARGRPPQGYRQREEQTLRRVHQELADARAAAQAAPPGERHANTTDPDSRFMKIAQGWLQGYNAQVVVTADQIVIAHAVTQATNDKCQYQPMIAAAQQCLAAAGVAQPIELVLGDAGYWSEQNATAAGPDRLLATSKDWKQRQTARRLGITNGPPPPDATPIEAMEHRLRTPQGAAAYAQRSHTVEPVFGNTKQNRGIRSFRRRGLPGVRSEWALITASHNLAKLYRHRQQTALT